MAAKVVNDAIVYKEFEPFCKWQRNEEKDVLEIHLQDFKKEQLKVQISNNGILKVSGQRSLSSDASKHTKFCKEIPVPTNKYDTQSIHAKFFNNKLIITLPKLKPSTPEINGTKLPSSEPSKVVDQTPAPESTAGALPELIQASTPEGNALTECRKRPRPTMGSAMANVAVSLAAMAAMAAMAAVVAVLVAYVVYMYKATTEIDD